MLVMEIFARLEERLLSSLDDDERTKQVILEIEQTYQSIEKLLEQDVFSNEELCLFYEQATRIKLIASHFASLEVAGHATLAAMGAEARDLLSSKPPSGCLKPKAKTISVEVIPAITMQETLNSKLLRRWFIDHVADPFPSKGTKEALVASTNALLPSAASTTKKAGNGLSTQPIDFSQCTLWFINSRRRSHWTDFYRQFAHSDKDCMRGLIECLQREEDAEEVGESDELEELLHCDKPAEEECCQDTMEVRVSECREMYSNMMNWLRQVTKEEVGDWMDQVIQEAKAELKSEKEARLAERKRQSELQDRVEQAREDQKRKVPDQEEPVAVRRSDRSKGRKIGEHRVLRDRGQLPVWFHTPNRIGQETQFLDTPVDSNWPSHDGNLRVSPSTSSSSGGVRVFSSSSLSSSSLSSYDAFPRVPGSPTLDIKTCKTMDNVRDALQLATSKEQLPVDPSLLYTSNDDRPKQSGASVKPSILVNTLPVEGHLEEELSGGSRSRLSRSSSYAAIKVEQASPSSLAMEWS